MSDAVVTEGIHLIEDAGPLDDAAAMRDAFRAHREPTEMARRIIHRGRSLGQRLGLTADLERARHCAPWVAVALVLLIVVAGLGLAGSVVGGSERRINVMAALLGLLGIHALTLVAWLVGLVVPLRPGAAPRASLAWLWMTLTARVAGGKHGQAPVLLRATARLLARARLLPWAAGIASHGIWTLSFVVVLAAMLFALAFHRYTLTWETTILDPQFFVRAVDGLGRAPARLGFPTPDAAAIRAPGAEARIDGLTAADAGAQRAWALWLTGCIVVYGLLPRALLLVVSIAVWQSRKGGVAPDLDEPYYRRLIARFEAMAPPVVVDADPGAPVAGAVQGLAVGDSGGTNDANDALVVAAFELAPGHAWPPAGLPADAASVLDIDGSAHGRRQLLDTVANLRPRALLLAVRAASSPDRGTERLLRELLAHCGACRVWLVDDSAAGTADCAANARSPREATHAASRARWRRWLLDTGLAQVAAFDDLPTALSGWQE